MDLNMATDSYVQYVTAFVFKIYICFHSSCLLFFSFLSRVFYSKSGISESETEITLKLPSNKQSSTIVIRVVTKGTLILTFIIAICRLVLRKHKRGRNVTHGTTGVYNKNKCVTTEVAKICIMISAA